MNYLFKLRSLLKPIKTTTQLKATPLISDQKYLSLFNCKTEQQPLLSLNNQINKGQSIRSLYDFRVSSVQRVGNRRSTRPKRKNQATTPLTYEQSQFMENIGVTKSWNCWNTCNFNNLLILQKKV
jgi:hypothetical protein